MLTIHFLSILLLGTGFVICVYGNAITTRSDDEPLCPPPDNIEPCTCFKDPVTQRVTAKCSEFKNAYDIRDIFDRNPGWKLQDVRIERCSLLFLPAQMLENAHFQSLTVANSTLIDIFDTTPVKTPELNLYLDNVKITRTFHWKSIANATLLELGFFNMTIKTFDKKFKENIPEGVERMWYENTGTSSIRDQAFANLEKLQILVIRGGSLKTVSRNMFPKPWIVSFFDLSYQKISTLPEDFFTDMPKLSFFLFEGNRLTTISEKVFIKHQVFYAFKGNPINCNCNIKWVTESLQPAFLKGECAEPASFKGKQLGSLKQENFSYCQ